MLPSSQRIGRRLERGRTAARDPLRQPEARVEGLCRGGRERRGDVGTVQVGEPRGGLRQRAGRRAGPGRCRPGGSGAGGNLRLRLR